MSITLMRYKNGKPTPIKLSIWDAFKGAPPPRSRLHECRQCGKFHRPDVKHEPAASPPVSAAESRPETKGGKPAEGSKTDEASANEHNFTPEEDAKILEMKAENTAWAKIAEGLGNGRSKGTVSHRYKQIKPAETKPEEKPKEKSTKEDKKPEKPFEQMSKAEKKAFKGKQAQDEGLKKREEVKAQREKSKAEAAATTTVTEEALSKPLPVSEPTPLPEATASQTAIKDRQKWITVASKHFDKTGQRITPEQARKMAERAS